MTVEIQDELIGVSAKRAAEIARITTGRLRRWEACGLVRPRVRRQLGGKTVRLYGFMELFELLIVRELEDAVPTHVRKLRRLLEDLRTSYEHPWSELRWAHDRGEIFWQHPDGTWSGERRPNQGVLVETIDLNVIRARVRRSVQRDPETYGQVVKRRGVLASTPVIAGTRTPVRAVREFIDAGYRDEQILAEYPHLTRADIAAARAS